MLDIWRTLYEQSENPEFYDNFRLLLRIVPGQMMRKNKVSHC